MAKEPKWTQEENDVLYKNYGVITSKQIHEMGLLPRRTLKAIRARAKQKKLRSKLRSTTHFSNLCFWSNPNFINSYWAGEIASNGCIMKLSNKKETYVLQLTISIQDLEHLKKFKEAVGYTGEIKTYESTCSLSTRDKAAKHALCYIRLCQMRYCEKDLREKWGIVPQKTHRLAPPALTNNVLKLCYICGYIDGDGTISADYQKGIPYIGFCSCSYMILDWFQEVFDELFPCMIRGVPSALPRPKAQDDENCYLYTVSGFRAMKIMDILSRLPVPKLDRKWKNPRILEIMERYKQKYPVEWATVLPIEREIEEYILKNASSSKSATSVTTSPTIINSP